MEMDNVVGLKRLEVRAGKACKASMAFSTNGSRLLLGMGSAIHIVDVAAWQELWVMQLDPRDYILDCAFMPICLGTSPSQRGPISIASKAVHEQESVIQNVEHPSEPAASVTPSEAARTQDEMWASSIEARISAGELHSTSGQHLLLLTFVRQTQELEEAVLASSLARSASPFRTLKPNWAKGAKILVDVSEDGLAAMLPTGFELKPWHVVLREQDENAFNRSIAHLPEPVRRLKCNVGRRVLYRDDISSVQANPDDVLHVPDIEVRNGFVHFPQSCDTRSALTD